MLLRRGWFARLHKQRTRHPVTLDRQALARLIAHLSKLLDGLPAFDARKRAHNYGSIAHEELIGVGFTPDEATDIIEAVLVDVFYRLKLGDPDEINARQNDSEESDSRDPFGGRPT